MVIFDPFLVIYRVFSFLPPFWPIFGLFFDPIFWPLFDPFFDPKIDKTNISLLWAGRNPVKKGPFWPFCLKSSTFSRERVFFGRISPGPQTGIRGLKKRALFRVSKFLIVSRAKSCQNRDFDTFLLKKCTSSKMGGPFWDPKSDQNGGLKLTPINDPKNTLKRVFLGCFWVYC